MKYNKFYDIPQHLFIEHYEKINNQLIIYYGDGNVKKVNYSKQEEKQILKAISSQLKECKEIYYELDKKMKFYNSELKQTSSWDPEEFFVIFFVFSTFIGISFIVLGPIIFGSFCLILIPYISYLWVENIKESSEIKRKKRDIKTCQEMYKSVYITEHLISLKHYANKDVLEREKVNIGTPSLPVEIIPNEKELLLNDLEIYTLKSLRKIVMYEHDKNFPKKKNIGSYKKKAPKLVLEKHRIKS